MKVLFFILLGLQLSGVEARTITNQQRKHPYAQVALQNMGHFFNARTDRGYSVADVNMALMLVALSDSLKIDERSHTFKFATVARSYDQLPLGTKSELTIHSNEDFSDISSMDIVITYPQAYSGSMSNPAIPSKIERHHYE